MQLHSIHFCCKALLQFAVKDLFSSVQFSGTLSWASLHVQTLPAKGPQHAGRGQALMAAIKHPELPQASAATAASNAAGLWKSIVGVTIDVNSCSH